MNVDDVHVPSYIGQGQIPNILVQPHKILLEI